MFLFLAGIGLTILTGGLFTIVAGAAIIGAGSSLIISPIKKRFTGEAITNKDIRQEIVFGGVVGALATPLGLITTIATKSASDAVRLSIRNRKSLTLSEESIKCVNYRSTSEFKLEEMSEEPLDTQTSKF